MRWTILAFALATACCTQGGVQPTNTAPAGQATGAPTGAGPQPGASAGTSVGGGPAGTGTADSAGGAK